MSLGDESWASGQSRGGATSIALPACPLGRYLWYFPDSGNWGPRAGGAGDVFPLFLVFVLSHLIPKTAVPSLRGDVPSL